jgi:hypothetical protein
MALTTAAQIAALKTEITTDPTGLGYAAAVAAGATAQLAAILNLPRAGISVFRSEVSGADLISAVVLADFLLLTSAQQQFFLACVGAAPLDATNANLRASLGALFPVGASRTALVAAASRQGSRAEQLFGVNVKLNTEDLAAALV